MRGHNPNSKKNLVLGWTPEAKKKMVEKQKRNKHPWRQPYNLGLGAKSTYKIYG